MNLLNAAIKWVKSQIQGTLRNSCMANKRAILKVYLYIFVGIMLITLEG